MKKTIIFDSIMPSKKNSKQVFCRRGKAMVMPSKAYQRWHGESEIIHKDIFSLKGGGYTFTYTFHIPRNKDGADSKRQFDYSNKIESINDFLVDMGAIEDDNYDIISEQHVYGKKVDYGEGKVIVEITK